MRKLLSLVALLWLTGCGFQPVYGTFAPHFDPSGRMNSIAVAPIANRDGQILRNHLIDRLYLHGAPQTPRYQLKITLADDTIDLGIRKDAIATRAQRRQYADWVLVDTKTSQRIMSARSRSIVSYNIIDSAFATRVTSEDAQRRALEEIGDDITSRIGLFLSQHETVNP